MFAAYFVLFALGIIFLQGKAHPAEFITFVSVITLALLVICWKKGEPPRWRWGGE